MNIQLLSWFGNLINFLIFTYIAINIVNTKCVKNSKINSGACSEFLSTSKIKFAYPRIEVGGLRKFNFLSFNVFEMSLSLIGLLASIFIQIVSVLFEYR